MVDYTCTNSFADVGLTIVLPSAGTYLLETKVLGIYSFAPVGAVGNKIETQLYDKTAAAQIPRSTMYVLTCSVAGVGLFQTAAHTIGYTVSGASTISLQAQEVTGGGDPSGAVIINSGSGDGSTLISWLKIG